MSDEEKNKEKEKLNERMRNLRERTKPQGEKKVTMTSTLWAPGQLYGESELYLQNNKMAKKRLKGKREKFTSEERENENKEAKIRMRELRDKQTDCAAVNSATFVLGRLATARLDVPTKIMSVWL